MSSFLSFFFSFFWGGAGAVQYGLQDLSFPTRDWTGATAVVKALSPNHCTARDFPLIPTPASFFTKVFPFHIPHLWTILTGKKHLFSNWQREEIFHSYLLRPGSGSFPASHLCRVSSVRNPVKPTPPGWSSQPHPQRPMSPKTPKIGAHWDAWDWQN